MLFGLTGLLSITYALESYVEALGSFTFRGQYFKGWNFWGDLFISLMVNYSLK